MYFLCGHGVQGLLSSGSGASNASFSINRGIYGSGQTEMQNHQQMQDYRSTKKYSMMFNGAVVNDIV